MKKFIFLLPALLAAIESKGQIPQPDPDTTAKHFLIIASIGNLQEVSAGNLAVEKAKSSNVRSFGQMMVKDHGEAEQQLLTLAKQQHIDLPTTATGGIQPNLELKKAGSNFDKLYVHAMVSGHRNTVHTFETYATTGKNAEVRAFAKGLLPILQRHLNEISALEKNIK